MELMNRQKGRFSLEEDYVYIVLRSLVVEKGKVIEAVTANALYSLLEVEAERIGIKDFSRHYRSPVSIGRRLSNVVEELREAMEVEIWENKAKRQKMYSFGPLGGLEPEVKREESMAEEPEREWEPGEEG
jgi:hypothetical protein